MLVRTQLQAQGYHIVGIVEYCYNKIVGASKLLCCCEINRLGGTWKSFSSKIFYVMNHKLGNTEIFSYISFSSTNFLKGQ